MIARVLVVWQRWFAGSLGWRFISGYPDSVCHGLSPDVPAAFVAFVADVRWIKIAFMKSGQ